MRTSKQTMKERFIQNNTKVKKDGTIRMLSCFRQKYGDMSIDEAFELFYAEAVGYMDLKKKVDEFEDFLRETGCNCVQSNISESRYYYWNGVKYRFSSHVYPTGSMTDEIMNVVDLAANPELIENITWK